MLYQVFVYVFVFVFINSTILYAIHRTCGVQTQIHNMKLPNYLILSLLYSLIIITTSSPGSESPESIPTFPSTDTRKPECGRFTVDGCNPPHSDKQIQLEYEGPHFDLIHIAGNNISIGDPELKNRLYENGYFDPTLPKSLVSLTLFSHHRNSFTCFYDCKESISDSAICSQFIRFHKPAPEKFCNCSVIQVNITRESDQDADINSCQLPDKFTLKFTYSNSTNDFYRNQGIVTYALSLSLFVYD